MVKEQPNSLSLLTYNIQAASMTTSYRDYVTKGWRQLWPHRHQVQHLNAIGSLLGHYDFIGLQEVDGGSFRSGFINQTCYLAGRAGMPFWFSRPNRNVGNYAKHSNGLISRYEPSRCLHRKLPGVPGRGLLIAEYDYGDEALAVIVVHLALGGQSQRRQLEYIRKLARQYPHCIILGDFNRTANTRPMRDLLSYGFVDGCQEGMTFPSWRPRRKIDYILVSKELEICSSEVVEYYLSDHLPVRLEVRLPETVKLSPQP